MALRSAEAGREDADGDPAYIPRYTWKSVLPTAPVGLVPRPRLVARLLKSDSRVVSIVAPAGYGKTALLGEWSSQVPKAAYLALDVHDNDPVTLAIGIATALDQVEPIDPALARLFAAPHRSLEASLLPGLLEAIWAHTGPIVLMLDELHLLADRAALDVVGFIMLRLPPHVRLALASRHRSALPFARLRAQGHLLDLGADDLALDEAGVQALGDRIGVSTSPEERAVLIARTEGWPAATYLALRSVASGTNDRQLIDFRGTEASVAEYMRSELLESLDPATQWWLRRASVLDVMNGPLCDTALGTTGSLARLRQLEGHNLFVNAIDAHREGFRFHRLFRDMLRDQLDEQEPTAAAEVNARAAAWAAAHDAPEQAVDYAHASGDMDLTARLVGAYFFPMHWSGRTATLRGWLSWFDRDGERERRAPLAVLAAWAHATDGHTSEARRWLASATRSSDPGPMPDGATRDAWIALLRGFMAPNGAEALKADARAGLDGIPPDSPWRQTALILGGLAHITAGATDAADQLLAEAVELSATRKSIPGLTLALGERALLAVSRGDMAAAAAHVQRGLTLARDAGTEEESPSVALHAAAVRTALASGATSEARAAIGHVNRLRPRVTAATPVLALQARLETIRACVMLREGAAARALLFEVKDILRQCPDLGIFVQEAAAVGRMIDGLTGSTAGPWTLTAAELRVLAYLPTHLTFREIADRLFVSPHTVKSQAVAIYGKLGVSTRRGAIEEAVDAGLLEASVIRVTDAGRIG